VLSGNEKANLPWDYGKMKDFEYKLVQLRGFFREERMFVRKQKDGKSGFSVFAPFVHQ
jgi:surfeit locus 1 family protein